jgi:hypothetical protein
LYASQATDLPLAAADSKSNAFETPASEFSSAFCIGADASDGLIVSADIGIGANLFESRTSRTVSHLD